MLLWWRSWASPSQVNGPHTSAIRTIHVEQDHAVNNIRYQIQEESSILLKYQIPRRWVVGLVEYVAGMPPHEVLQMFRITKSDKIDPPGYCVAVSHEIDELQTLNFSAMNKTVYGKFVMNCYLVINAWCINRMYF